MNSIISQVLWRDRHLPSGFVNKVYETERDELTTMLSTVQIYPEMIPSLVDKLKIMYQRKAEPGLAVGIITAQSIGEQQTQSTLNSFHKAGLAESTVITGVPRFAELVDATQSEGQHGQISRLYFKDKIGSIAELRRVIGSDLKHLTFGDVITSVVIHPSGKKKEDWYSHWENVYDETIDSTLPCVTYLFDMGKLYPHNIRLDDICDRLNDINVQCVWSPLANGQVDIFIADEEWGNEDSRLTEEEELYMYLERTIRIQVEKVSICGILSIRDFFYCKDEETNEWMVETDGSDLTQVFQLPYIDKERSFSNDPWEIYNVFGVDALRSFLIEEFHNIMPQISFAHISLLADRMTFSGSLDSMTRYTRRHEKSTVLSKATFEQTLDNIVDGALKGVLNKNNDASSAVVCGKIGDFGTGLCSMIYAPTME